MEKQLYELKIDTELERFFPPLSENEIAILTNSLINDGCISPLIVWNGTIIDGYNRYRICHEKNIPFEYIEKVFENKESVKLWMLDEQIGRRNISDFSKCELAYSLEKKIREAVENKRREAISRYRKAETGLNLTQSHRTADIIADYVGVSSSKWKMAKFIIENADANLKRQIRKKEISIYAAYKKLKHDVPSENRHCEDICTSKEEEYSPAEDGGGESNWWDLIRCDDNNRDDTPEPDNELVGDFKPIVYLTEPLEVFSREPKREPKPFPFAMEHMRAAMKTMLIEVKTSLGWLNDEDLSKCSEILEILEDAYNQAKNLIREEAVRCKANGQKCAS